MSSRDLASPAAGLAFPQCPSQNRHFSFGPLGAELPSWPEALLLRSSLQSTSLDAPLSILDFHRPSEEERNKC